MSIQTITRTTSSSNNTLSPPPSSSHEQKSRDPGLNGSSEGRRSPSPTPSSGSVRSPSPGPGASPNKNDLKTRGPEEKVHLSLPMPGLKRRVTGGLSDVPTTPTSPSSYLSAFPDFSSSGPAPPGPSLTALPFSRHKTFQSQTTQGLDEETPAGDEALPPVEGGGGAFSPPPSVNGGSFSPPLHSTYDTFSPPTFGGLVFQRQQTVGGDQPKEDDSEPPADSDDLPPVSSPLPPSAGGLGVLKPLLFQRQQTVGGDQPRELENEPPADNDELPPTYPPSRVGAGPLLFHRQQTVGGDQPREPENEPPADSDELPPAYGAAGGLGGMGPLLFQRQPTVGGDPREENEPPADSDELPSSGAGAPPPFGALLFQRQPTVGSQEGEDKSEERGDRRGGLFGGEPTEAELAAAESDDLPPIPGGHGVSVTFQRQQTVGPDVGAQGGVEGDQLAEGLPPPTSFSLVFQRQQTVEVSRGIDSDDEGGNKVSSSYLGIPPLNNLVFQRHSTSDSNQSDDENVRDIGIRSLAPSSATTNRYFHHPQGLSGGSHAVSAPGGGAGLGVGFLQLVSSVTPLPSPSIPTDQPLFNRVPTDTGSTQAVPALDGSGLGIGVHLVSTGVTPSSSVPTDSPLFSRVPTDTDPHGDEVTGTGGTPIKKYDRAVVSSPSTLRSYPANHNFKISPILSSSSSGAIVLTTTLQLAPSSHSYQQAPPQHEVPVIDPLFNRLPTETDPHG